jgi:hypothetical protein
LEGTLYTTDPYEQVDFCKSWSIHPRYAGEFKEIKRLAKGRACDILDIEPTAAGSMEDILMKRFKELRKKILPVLLPYGVKRITLFRSAVRDELTPESDVDILVELKAAW